MTQEPRNKRNKNPSQPGQDQFGEVDVTASALEKLLLIQTVKVSDTQSFCSKL